MKVTYNGRTHSDAFQSILDVVGGAYAHTGTYGFTPLDRLALGMIDFTVVTSDREGVPHGVIDADRRTLLVRAFCHAKNNNAYAYPCRGISEWGDERGVLLVGPNAGFFGRDAMAKFSQAAILTEKGLEWSDGKLGRLKALHSVTVATLAPSDVFAKSKEVLDGHVFQALNNCKVPLESALDVDKLPPYTLVPDGDAVLCIIAECEAKVD